MGFDLGTAIAGAGTGFMMGGPMGALAGGALGGFGSDILGAKTGQTSYQAALDPEILKQQKLLAETLRAQAAGAGPSLAQEQLKRATNQNVAQAAALAASQKGLSPALAARQALQAGTMAQQEAAGQSGVMQAQQQLAAQQQLGSLLSGQQTQSLEQQRLNQAAAQANAAADAQQRAGIAAALGTIGSTYATAKSKTPTPTPSSSFTPTQQVSLLPKLEMPSGPLTNEAPATPNYLTLSQGGQVDGVAVDDGDSDANDTVPAMLSPGEIVIPRSITESDNAGALAKKFVEKTLKEGPSYTNAFADGGMTMDYVAPTYGGYGADAQALGTKFAETYQEPTREQKLADRIDWYKKQSGSKIIDPITEQQIMGQLNKEEEERGARRAENMAPEINKAKMQYQQEAQRAQFLGKQAPPLPTILGGHAPVPTTPSAAPSQEYQPIEKIKPQTKEVSPFERGVKAADQINAKEDEQAGILSRMQDIQKEKQDVMKQAMLKAEEADKALDELKPQDYWADKSTGTKIAAGIALALGAYSSTISGGPNQAMQVINSAIDRDLQLQKDKYQRAKDRGASIRTAYADQVAMLGDQEAAELTMLNSYYKKLDMQLKMREAQTTNDVQKLNMMKLRQEIGAAAEDNNTKRIQRLSLLNARTGGQVNPEALPEKDRERYVVDPEFGGLAPTSAGAAKVREAVTSYRNTKDLLNKLKQINETPGKSLNPKLRAEAQNAVLTLRGQLRGEIVGPGAVTPYEYGILESVVKNPTDFFAMDSVTKARFQALEDKINTNMYNIAKANNITPRIAPSESNVVYVRVPGGQPQKIAKQNLDTAKQRAAERGVQLEVSDVGF